MDIFILLSLVFFHIIADFHVQNTFMAKYKQAKEWKIYGKPYLYDWVPVLVVHSFSWAFFTFLPLLYYVYNKDMTFNMWAIVVGVNTVIHFIIDDQKCNRFRINLIQDQLYHLLQIFGTTGLAIAITIMTGGRI